MGNIVSTPRSSGGHYTNNVASHALDSDSNSARYVRLHATIDTKRAPLKTSDDEDDECYQPFAHTQKSVARLFWPRSHSSLLDLPIELRTIIYTYVLGGAGNEILFENIPTTHRFISTAQPRGEALSFEHQRSIFTCYRKIRDYRVPPIGQKRLRAHQGFNRVDLLLTCKMIYHEVRLLHFANNTITLYHTRTTDSLLPSLRRLYDGEAARAIRRLRIIVTTSGRKDPLNLDLLAPLVNTEELVLDIGFTPCSTDIFNSDRGRSRLESVKRSVFELCKAAVAKRVVIAFFQDSGKKLDHQGVLHKYLNEFVKELEEHVTRHGGEECMVTSGTDTIVKRRRPLKKITR